MTDTKTTATETKEQERNPRISLARPAGRLELTKTVDSGMVRQSFSHGRSKSVAVEVKRKRQLKSPGPGAGRPVDEAPERASARASEALRARAEVAEAPARRDDRAAARRGVVLKPLTEEEKSARVRALADAKRAEDEARRRSEANAQRLAEEAIRRQREREKRQAQQLDTGQIVREVVLPETITVAELANRMAVRGADVVKQLMKMGVMATINQVLDADTAELLVAEFGHQVKRVSEADVEIGLEGEEDRVADVQPRAPVVTVMGHVDHGKTSLLDALRRSDVAAHEAGGITQHIGAYQVDIGTGRPVTFIDTPGHAAFTEMRARGARVTDIVVLVVAADDGVMPQTIEAISHAKAARVPIVVAINKIDVPDANPERVKQELLNHELVPEEFGGEVLCVEVSAIKRQNLDRLIETIQLQAEVLELTANPSRDAQGAVIEARLDRGRGVVATVLIQRGTLHMGEIVICGSHWGRARALIDDRGQNV